MKTTPGSLSVVIPVYNSQETLEPLVERLGRVLPAFGVPFEVVLVNDGSRDASWETICQLSQGRPWLRGFNLMRNYGQHNAVLCGIQAARYDAIITMDDDLQHPPEEIHKLLAKLEEGYDVVYGLPQELPHSWWRNAFSLFIKRVLASIMGVPNMRDFSSFRVFHTRLRKAFQTYQNPNVQVDVLLSWATTRFTSLRIHEEPRQHGRSNYTFLKLFQYTMLVLTGFSTAPLRIASMVGFFFTLVGIAVFLYVLGVYFFLGSIPGFPFLASIISLFSGTQLFALGIFGEYLARIFDRSMERPPYVIGDSLEPASVPEPAVPDSAHRQVA